MRYVALMVISAACLVFFQLEDSHSGESAYSCTVLGEHVLDDDGNLQTRRQRLYEGKQFHVDRVSGTILGSVWSNAGYWEKTVLHVGSDSAAFSVFSVSRAELGTYLTVKEWTESQIKPFVFLVGSEVLTGTCT